MKKAIYTVITGGYDPLNFAPIAKGWDTILFTDKRPNDLRGWDLRLLEPSDNPLLQSRDIKIRSHIHLSEYDLVCYMDANQKLLQRPPEHPIWFKHPRRNNIFQEAKQIIVNGRFSADDITPQMLHYQEHKYVDKGLYLNGYFVRDHSELINRLHDTWYHETSKYTPRDQLSLPYSIFKTGIYPKGLSMPSEVSKYTIVIDPHHQLYEGSPHNTGSNGQKLR